MTLVDILERFSHAHTPILILQLDCTPKTQAYAIAKSEPLCTTLKFYFVILFEPMHSLNLKPLASNPQIFAGLMR